MIISLLSIQSILQCKLFNCSCTSGHLFNVLHKIEQLTKHNRWSIISETIYQKEGNLKFCKNENFTF